MAELDNKANEKKAVSESTEISKLELIKLVVSEMKSMDKDALRSVFSSINEEDVDASLTKAEIARSIVESMKDMDRDQVSEIHEKVKASEEDEEDDSDDDEVEESVQDDAEDAMKANDSEKKKAEPKKATEPKAKSESKDEDDEDEDEMEEGYGKKKMKEMDDEDDSDEDEVEESAQDDAEDAMKANDAEKKKVEPKKAPLPEEVDIDEDIRAIAESLELSEENTEKAHTIFKAAVTSKVNHIKEELETQFEEKIETSVKEIHEELAEAVDKYLTYCAEEWTKENELAIERGLRSEMTENFITGLKTLFTEHYVDIPDEKYNVMDELSNRLDEMETKLDVEVSKNMDLSEEVTELKRANVVRDACSDLTESQREKLVSLAEGVDFKNEEDYAEKITEIKEAYFSVDSETIAEETVVEEGTGQYEEEDSTSVTNPEMRRYLSAISNLKPF